MSDNEHKFFLFKSFYSENVNPDIFLKVCFFDSFEEIFRSFTPYHSIKILYSTLDEIRIGLDFASLSEEYSKYKHLVAESFKIISQWLVNGSFSRNISEIKVEKLSENLYHYGFYPNIINEENAFFTFSLSSLIRTVSHANFSSFQEETRDNFLYYLHESFEYLFDDGINRNKYKSILLKHINTAICSNFSPFQTTFKGVLNENENR